MPRPSHANSYLLTSVVDLSDLPPLSPFDKPILPYTMYREENRWRTFINWPPNIGVDPRYIAKAGFYYTGRNQEVKCFQCGVVISDWNCGEQILERHRRLSPTCLLVLNPTETYNIPICPTENGSAVVNSRRRSESDIHYGVNQVVETYEERLRSFANWPSTHVVSPESLARAGFHYLHHGDMVECVFCRGVIMKWEPGDIPNIEHRLHFPECDFFMRNGDGDNELPSAKLESSMEKLELKNVKLMPGTTSDLKQLGIQTHSAPRQPKHATFEGRLSTFQGWPSHLRQTPEMLAIAGFYYVGLQDHVRCFHCDGGLRHWEATDDAWTEHARWFPKCEFVALIRGQEFIKQCIENWPPFDSSIYAGISEDENGDNSSTPPLPTVSARSSPVRRVTDAELEEMLNSQPATVALEIGLHVGRIKMALKKRIETTGIPYSNADQLIEDATQIQLGEEDNIQTSESPSAELTYLLNQIIAQAPSSSRSIQNQPENDSRVGVFEVQENGIGETEATTSSNDNATSKECKKSSSKATRDEISLEEENRMLKEARLCKICMDREVAVVFLPCGHLTSCVFCAPSLTHCPMCRQEIRATVRTFLA